MDAQLDMGAAPEKAVKKGTEGIGGNEFAARYPQGQLLIRAYHAAQGQVIVHKQPLGALLKPPALLGQFQLPAHLGEQLYAQLLFQSVDVAGEGGRGIAQSLGGLLVVQCFRQHHKCFDSLRVHSPSTPFP